MTRRSAPVSTSQSVNVSGAERRKRRSGEPATALSLLLDAVRRRQGYSALAVADSSGLLVAGSGHFAECEELAALAPLVTPAPRATSAPQKKHPGDARPEVERVLVDGMEVLVAGSGGRTPGLGAVAAGCARILGRALPPTAAWAC